jgi:hypothetical protein
VNPNLKKDYIITSKKAITYLQSYIIDRAGTVAQGDAGIVAMDLIIKMIKDIRTVTKK